MDSVYKLMWTHKACVRRKVGGGGGGEGYPCALDASSQEKDRLVQ